MVTRPPAGLVDRMAVVLGVGLALYGTWMLSVPAAYILAGTLLVAGAMRRTQ